MYLFQCDNDLLLKSFKNGCKSRSSCNISLQPFPFSVIYVLLWKKNCLHIKSSLIFEKVTYVFTILLLFIIKNIRQPCLGDLARNAVTEHGFREIMELRLLLERNQMLLRIYWEVSVNNATRKSAYIRMTEFWINELKFNCWKC